MKRIKLYKRFVRFGLLAGAVAVSGLVGCDSTPPPPTDPSPTIPDTGVTKKGKAMQVPGKGGPPPKAAPKS